ncbi:hypothetical protein E3N88_00149 [Mikania micrantha]|uniref:Reverse transcriptase domain-containing protein n=1 Tax=Mikania micrantha TaxID=192012 RepID=A0A5N6PY43_9ASTR|nr:hypothetical protein E3N88_00149 [Mikania micrantha]
MVFIDLEKAYDSVPRQVMWDTLESRGIPQNYIEAIKDTYENAKTSVREPVGDTDFFLVEVGLHQGSTLSPFLFTVIMDELSRPNEEDENEQLTIGDQEVPMTTKFKYQGLFIQGDEDIDSDVAHRSGDQASHDVRHRFWPIKKNQTRKLETAEMRMLRWICGHTMLDRIRNEVFRERLEVANIWDKVREGRLRWFGYVRRRSQATPVRKVEFHTVEGKKGKG